MLSQKRKTPLHWNQSGYYQCTHVLYPINNPGNSPRNDIQQYIYSVSNGPDNKHETSKTIQKWEGWRGGVHTRNTIRIVWLLPYPVMTQKKPTIFLSICKFLEHQQPNIRERPPPLNINSWQVKLHKDGGK